MKKSFEMRQKKYKIKISNTISNTWMCWDPGDDELGNCDQGWLDSSFWQETESTVQHQSWIGSRPELKSESAGCTNYSSSSSLSFFQIQMTGTSEALC